MTGILNIVARIKASPGEADALEKEMMVLVDDTRKEAGCIRYDLFRDTQEPDIFVFVEEWETRALWEDHMAGEAIRSFNARIGEGRIAEGQVMQLGQVA